MHQQNTGHSGLDASRVWMSVRHVRMTAAACAFLCYRWQGGLTHTHPSNLNYPLCISYSTLLPPSLFPLLPIPHSTPPPSLSPHFHPSICFLTWFPEERKIPLISSNQTQPQCVVVRVHMCVCVWVRIIPCPLGSTSSALPYFGLQKAYYRNTSISYLTIKVVS